MKELKFKRSLARADSDLIAHKQDLASGGAQREIWGSEEGTGMRRFEDEYGTAGYRAFISSDDEAWVWAFQDWCADRGITYSTGFDPALPQIEDCWTQWVTDEALVRELHKKWKSDVSSNLRHP